ncbi:unnamed protein product [Schistocephalus solidus]|uniref:Signal peptidase complex subunit 2 n=1 Tax=Schistocephalus solidus TaxID=70667 RepID=A0A183SIH1_SCHSO|nr:unnamed protein product [Schistocephalus solidus]
MYAFPGISVIIAADYSQSQHVPDNRPAFNKDLNLRRTKFATVITVYVLSMISYKSQHTLLVTVPKAEKLIANAYFNVPARTNNAAWEDMQDP